MAKTKKQIILDYCKRHGIQRAGPDELRQIREEIRSSLGVQERTPYPYIAQVLHRAGIALEEEDRYHGPPMAEPYAGQLKGALQFRDLDSAEASLRKLDEAYRTYVRASDRLGISLVRSLLLKGKQRAQNLAANPRVNTVKRMEKQEIARWFTVWLQTPDLFFNWLDIRKRSEEFQRMFSTTRAEE